MVGIVMNKNRNDIGFTLVEVLIALLIIGIALGAIIKAINDNIRGLNYIQEKTVAQWAALNLISSAQLGIVPLPKTGDSESTTTNMINKTWYLKLRLDQAAHNSQLITVNVALSKNGSPITTLYSYLKPSGYTYAQ